MKRKKNYSIEQAPYEYTEYGEKVSIEKAGVKRKAGDVAFFGLNPLHDGSVAETWLKRGYVRKRILKYFKYINTL